MKSFVDCTTKYYANRKQANTRIMHMAGFFAILFALLILFGWIHITIPTIIDINLAWIFSLLLLVCYFRIDWQVAAVLTPVFIVLNLIACLFSQPHISGFGFWSFIIIASIGAGLLLAGFKKEASEFNYKHLICDAMTAPMILVLELMVKFGLRKDLQDKTKSSESESSADK